MTVKYNEEYIKKLYKVDEDNCATETHTKVAKILKLSRQRAHQIANTFNIKSKRDRKFTKDQVFEAFKVEIRNGKNFYRRNSSEAAKLLKISLKKSRQLMKKFSIEKEYKYTKCGTCIAYNYGGCRCDLCKEANRLRCEKIRMRMKNKNV